MSTPHALQPSTSTSAPAAGSAPMSPDFPIGAGLLLGLGLGGFFDGTVLRQLLQWHHMLSSRYPTDTLENLRLNTLWDGLFHSATYLLVVVGVWRLWRAPRPLRIAGAAGPHAGWRWPLVACLLAGWGIFNVVEGIVDHQLLGIHHVNERVAREHWLAWDLGFLAWGGAMLASGVWMLRARRSGSARRRDPQAVDVADAA